MNSITGADGWLEIQSLDYEILILDLCSSKLDKSEREGKDFFSSQLLLLSRGVGEGGCINIYIYMYIYTHTYVYTPSLL